MLPWLLPWYIYCLLSALLAAAASVIGKHTLFREHAMEFSATLAFVNAAITAPFFLTADFGAIPPHAYALILLAGIIGATAYLFVTKAVRHMPISLSSPLLALGPALTALLAFVILGERLTMTNALGLLLVIAGIFIIEHRPGVSIGKSLSLTVKERYVRYILWALVLYAAGSVIDRYLLGPEGIGIGVPPLSYLALVHVAIALVFLVMMVFFHDGVKGIGHGLRTAWVPIVVIGALTVGYRLATIVAASTEAGKIALVDGIKRTSAFFATFLGGELFHEDHLLRRVFAALIIIGGVLLIII